MLLPIDYSKLKDSECLFVDVRSPAEYKEATIEGAVNLALFTDDERRRIGTIYKQDSSHEAKRIGIEIVSKKLPELFDRITQLRQNSGKKIVLFCARGGMRSTSLALLLNALGENVYYLKDGYKGYRRVVVADIQNFNQEVTYIVLHGRTGVGKTKILEALKALDLDILDLEGAANHRGSLLGGVGLGAQPSTKKFESNIYHMLKRRKSNYVFIEAESRRIGKLFVPQCIKDHMQDGYQILIEASLDFRADHLISEYTGLEAGNEELLAAIDKIRRYMGNTPVDDLKTLVDQGNFREVAKTLMSEYYDPMYDHSISKYRFDATFEVDSFDHIAKDLQQWSNLKVNQ